MSVQNVHIHASNHVWKKPQFRLGHWAGVPGREISLASLSTTEPVWDFGPPRAARPAENNPVWLWRRLIWRPPLAGRDVWLSRRKHVMSPRGLRRRLRAPARLRWQRRAALSPLTRRPPDRNRLAQLGDNRETGNPTICQIYEMPLF